MSDVEAAIASTQNWGRQTIIHAMTKRARALDKVVEPKQMQSMAREMEDIAQKIWSDSISSAGTNPEPHEIMNVFTSKTLDWCGDHLGWND